MAKLQPWPVPEPWAAAIDEWVAAQRAAGYSDQTLKTRRCQISHLARALGGAPETVTGRELVAYFGSRDWSRNTRKGYRDSAKRFWAWMQRTGQREDSPVDLMERVREATPCPRPCPDKWILDAVERADSRTMLMLRLGAECGMRRSEIAAVRGDDVVEGPSGWSLSIVGKGERLRVIPISDELARLVAAHEGFVFPGGHDGHLCANTVGKLMSDLLPDGWSPHTLRHRYATRLYEETRDIYVVARLLGHASVATTQRYVALPEKRLREAASSVMLQSR